MSIRWKIIAILSAVTLLYAGIDHASLRALMSGEFERMEEEQGADALGRVVQDLQREKEDLARLAAAWTEDLVSRRPEELEAAGTSLMRGAGVHALYLCRADGSVLFGRILDPLSASPIELREFPQQALSASHPALAWFDGRPDRQAFAVTGRGVLALASKRTGEALSGGTLVVGRFLDATLLEAIEAREGVKLELFSGDWRGSGLAPEVLEKIRASEGGVVFEEGPDEMLRIVRTLPDWEGRDEILLQVDGPRRVALRGAKITGYALLSSVATSLILLFVLLRLLERIVIRPLGRLTLHAVGVGESGSTSTRLELSSRDELGTLAREFDRMLVRLEELRREAANASRLAGMSEIATGVLHNVGNALNGVTVAAGMARARAERLAASDLKRMVDELERQDDLAAFFSSQGRGRHLVAFARELGDGLVAQRADVLDELDHLDETVQRIAFLVSAQHSLSTGRGYAERVDLTSQVDEVLKMTSTEGTDPGFELRCEYGDVPETLIDRHRLVEILLVLISNARQAVMDLPRAERRIVLRLRKAGSHRLCIEIEDNGVGIAAENLTRIFSGGFTTKRSGLGYSLHHAANAATELGGTLSCESAGPGEGACFRLEFPLVDACALA